MVDKCERYIIDRHIHRQTDETDNMIVELLLWEMENYKNLQKSGAPLLKALNLQNLYAQMRYPGTRGTPVDRVDRARQLW